MTRLRSDATQAIARALKRRRFGEPEDFASQLMDAQPDPPIEEEATVVLDALLDYLESHADEWWLEWFRSERPLHEAALLVDHLDQLIAVLRVEPK